nr:dimethylamine monooxygenase subunit DmmA family protein [Jiella sonneratiae]
MSQAAMGTLLYLAGGEAFLDQATCLAEACGVAGDGVQTEHCGSTGRRVQCVHCKGMMADVTMSPVVCDHCGLHLTVRDHYSRRLGAFQGVCADAEAPGVLPEPTRIDA